MTPDYTRAQMDAAKRGADAVLTEVEAKARLGELFDFDAIGRSVSRVQVHGRGGKAHVRIDLDNGEWLEFDPLGAYSTAAKMNFEVSAQVGSEPSLKNPKEVAKLIFWLGEHYEAIETADRAWELGAEYLRTAVTPDVDMSDQTSRWEAFEHLDSTARRDVVLVDSKTGSRYVRTQWLVEYLRSKCDAGEAGAMKTQLERQGWRKSGGEGRVKATPPNVGKRPLQWAFLIVPEGWEDVDPSD